MYIKIFEQYGFNRVLLTTSVSSFFFFWEELNPGLDTCFITDQYSQLPYEFSYHLFTYYYLTTNLYFSLQWISNSFWYKIKNVR
jgi:hypothetical protein